MSFNTNKNFSETNRLAQFLNTLYNLKLRKTNFIRTIKHWDDDDNDSFDSMEAYMSLTQTISFTDSELIKIFTFIISHEFYHVITPGVSLENEVAADAYGILQYAKMSNSDFLLENIFTNFNGRSVPQIFLDIYSDTSIHEIDRNLYLPVEERFIKIDSILTHYQSQSFDSLLTK